MQIQGEMRTVGRRQPYTGGLAGAQGFLELIVELRRGEPLLPKGVYRFKTYAEEHEWTLKMLTRPKAGPQPSPTCSPSAAV